MGINIQGIALSRKLDGLQEIAEILGVDEIVAINESIFEEAISSNVDDFDVYITEVDNGTLITVGSGFDLSELSLAESSFEGKALKFMIGEASMFFALEFFIDGLSVRNILNAEGVNVWQQGDSLEEEAVEKNIEELIFRLIGTVTGTAFSNIEANHKSLHCQEA